MSGFTTTGATLIDEVEATPAGILLWRSATQWLGGIGFIVLIVALAPQIASGLQRFFYAEASGFSDSRITPRMTDTAKIVGGIYVTLTAMAGIGYLVTGMGPFDALNHALTTLATGGFSTRTASLGAFDSVGIETVAIIFMAAGSVNFALYWQLLKGKRQAPTVAEFTVLALPLALIDRLRRG